ncbi:hypothetical protein STEG23_024699 [Scotinomys teguina]
MDIQCQVTQYQALLLGQPCIQFHKMTALNQTGLLPDNDPAGFVQDCLEVTDLIQSIRFDMIVFLLILDNGLLTGQCFAQPSSEKLPLAGDESKYRDPQLDNMQKLKNLGNTKS